MATATSLPLTLEPSPLLYAGPFPDPDYTQHPAYGKFFGKPGWLDQIRAIKTLWPYFKKEYRTLRAQAWDRTQVTARLMNQTSLPVAQKLATFGALALQTEDVDKQAFIACVQPHLTTLEAHRQSIPGEQRTFMDNIQRIPPKESEVYQHINTLLDKLGILSAAEAYLGAPVEVHTLNLMMGDATDTWVRPPFEGIDLPDAPTTYMHIDTISRMLKCIWYLTPVTDEDGPFCYVPGSHRVPMSKLERAIRIAVCKLFSDNHDIESRRLFWSLPGFFRKRANFGNDTTPETPGIQDILAAEHRFTSQDGDMLLFDNSGFHRGSIFKSGSRTVVQIMLLPKTEFQQS